MKELDNISFEFPDIGGIEYDFDVKGFNLLDETETEETRYTPPSIIHYANEEFVCYDNAERLAHELKITKGMRADCFINGSFIFGDFLEAFLVENKAQAVKCTITTLSLSQENVDSLAGLLNQGYIKELNLIISAYYYANERRTMIPYIYEKLDIDNRFQLAVAGIHTKTIHLQTLGGKYIVMHGSANLRSSANIEQFTIEENEKLYKFYDSHFLNIIEKYATIRKPIRSKLAWDVFSKIYFKD